MGEKLTQTQLRELLKTTLRYKPPQVGRHPDRIARGGLMLGRILQANGNRLLQLYEGGQYPLEQVKWGAGRFNGYEGQQTYPRTWIIDDQGTTVQRGDVLLVGFIDELLDQPIIIESVRPGYRHEFFDPPEFASEDIQKERRDNLSRTLEINDDGKGEIVIDLTALSEGTGNVTLKIVGGDDENGRLIIDTSKNVVILSPKRYLCAENDEDQPIVLGRTLVEQLDTVLGELIKPSNITTPAGPGQFLPNIVSSIRSVKNSLEDILSERNFGE
jgi:hypothetical protein